MPPFHRYVRHPRILQHPHIPLKSAAWYRRFSGSPLRPLAALIAGAALCAAYAGLIASLLIGCEGGTSSGVDNPQLTVDFVNPSGMALRITGDLEVYSQDQNPALNPDPLITLKVTNAGFKVLDAKDFDRIQSANSKRAAGMTKTSASDEAGYAAVSTPILFNLILRTQDHTGGLSFGFKYDSAARAFFRVGGPAIKSVNLEPKPLVRYSAKVTREPVHGTGGRMFVPGSPFVATLVDSSFVIENLPEGLFPLRLLTADGKVYAVPDSLNSKDSTLIYHPRTTPIGAVDTSHKDTLPAYTVFAGDPHEAFVELASFLEGKIAGPGATDSRLSVLWRLIKDAADSGRADSLPHDTIPHDTLHPKTQPRHADIHSPTLLRSEVHFTEEGVYEFELAATLGVRTLTDTVVISVRHLPPPGKPRIIKPGPGDSVLAGKVYNIQWEMQDKGPALVQVSVDSGVKWITLAEHYPGQAGLQVFPWTPSRDLGASAKCFIQVRSDADTTQRARMEKPFTLLQ